MNLQKQYTVDGGNLRTYVNGLFFWDSQGKGILGIDGNPPKNRRLE